MSFGNTAAIHLRHEFGGAQSQAERVLHGLQEVAERGVFEVELKERGWLCNNIREDIIRVVGLIDRDNGETIFELVPGNTTWCNTSVPVDDAFFKKSTSFRKMPNVRCSGPEGNSDNISENWTLAELEESPFVQDFIVSHRDSGGREGG